MFKVPNDFTKEELLQLSESLRQGNLETMSPADRRKLMGDFILYVSKDAVNWAPIYNAKAVKKVLGIESGTVTFGMVMNNSDGVWSRFSLKMFEN